VTGSDVRRPGRAAALVAGLAIAVFGLWPAASHASRSLKACRPGKLCQNFRVQVSFKQHRVWTHHTSATNEECSRFASGNGSDDAELLEVGKASFSTIPSHPGHFAVAGVAMGGSVTKLGTASQSLSGPKCAPTTYFPSTWRIVTETGGGSTATEPATGCGTKKISVPKFPSLDLKGSTLHLDWQSSPEPPSFDPCPDFDGANDLAPDAKSMPNNNFSAVDIPVDLAAIANPKRHKFTARGSATYSAIENCQALAGGTCPPDTTYEATGTVETHAYVTFIRGKPHRYPRR
jgi:hypothetical protein